MGRGKIWKDSSPACTAAMLCQWLLRYSCLSELPLPASGHLIHHHCLYVVTVVRCHWLPNITKGSHRSFRVLTPIFINPGYTWAHPLLVCSQSQPPYCLLFIKQVDFSLLKIFLQFLVPFASSLWKFGCHSLAPGFCLFIFSWGSHSSGWIMLQSLESDYIYTIWGLIIF